MTMKFFVFSSIFVLGFTQIYGAEWSDFQRKHILDPATERYQNFKRNEWNNWLKNRTGSEYGTDERRANSVLIGDDATIVTLFDNDSPRWINGTAVKKDFFWSLKPNPMYVMKLQDATSDYDVYNCLDVYFVARVDMLSRPMHFAGHANQLGGVVGQDTSQCIVIGRNSSNSLYSLSILSLTVLAILNIVSFQ